MRAMPIQRAIQEWWCTVKCSECRTDNSGQYH